MLLTPIGTGKDAGSCLCESSIVVGMNVLHAFINKVQINLMTCVKSRLCETMNSLGARM
jgi:hypothetical protein